MSASWASSAKETGQGSSLCPPATSARKPPRSALSGALLNRGARAWPAKARTRGASWVQNPLVAFTCSASRVFVTGGTRIQGSGFKVQALFLKSRPSSGQHQHQLADVKATREQRAEPQTLHACSELQAGSAAAKGLHAPDPAMRLQLCMCVPCNPETLCRCRKDGKVRAGAGGFWV